MYASLKPQSILLAITLCAFSHILRPYLPLQMQMALFKRYSCHPPPLSDGSFGQEIIPNLSQSDHQR